MNHKTITKFVLGISMVASLGLSGTHGHAAETLKDNLDNSQLYAS